MEAASQTDEKGTNGDASVGTVEEIQGVVVEAVFPGDLPANPETALRHPHAQADDLRFVRFRPPDPVPLPSGGFAPFPNIRLDRALQALIGDRLT